MKIILSLVNLLRSFFVISSMCVLVVPMLFAIVIAWMWVSVSMLSQDDNSK